MQLKKSQMGRISQTLGLLTANLLLATSGQAQAADIPQSPAAATNSSGGIIDDTASALGTTTLDSSVLFYQETGGRVRAIEPVSRLNITGLNGDSFSAKLTYDSLTGATPNGAVPWKETQTFTKPAYIAGKEMTVTGASGNSKLVTIPGSDTQVKQYETPAHELPVDAGFKDTRYALDLGYTKQWTSNTRGSIGISGSKEEDYRSFSANVGISQDLNQHNTTLALGVNLEYDQSRPFYGTPTPLSRMDGDLKGPNDHKTVVSLVAGITQVMSRRWLLQLNYNIGRNNGYQTDPYKIISQVNPITGAPVNYLYEGRPDSRLRQSVYLGNKVAIGQTVADLSFRYYHDSWGINSITAEVSERVPISTKFYLEPEFRYYRQSAADFFHYYLLTGQPLPDYASSDYRLSKFNAKTFGLRMGYKLAADTEVYAVAEDYNQSGASTIPDAPGDLANENLFSGVHARLFMTGLKFTFR